MERQLENLSASLQLAPVPLEVAEFWRPILADINDQILACGGKVCWAYTVDSNSWTAVTASTYSHDYRPGDFPTKSYKYLFLIILFGSTTLSTSMTGISLHMQWPLTSQLHGSVSEREQLFFCYGSNSTSTTPQIFLKY
jgi:hypothetical protein